GFCKNLLQPKQSRRKKLERCPNHRKPLARNGAMDGALARGLLHTGNTRGQFLMSSRGYFRMSLDSNETLKTAVAVDERGPIAPRPKPAWPVGITICHRAALPRRHEGLRQRARIM